VRRLFEEAKLMFNICNRTALNEKKLFVHFVGFIHERIDSVDFCKAFDLPVGCITGVGIIMEYVSGGSLTKLLHPPEFQISIPFTLSMKLNICSQIAEAVAELHSLSVVHGDLKPENILVMKNVFDCSSQESVIRLSDFGLSSIVENVNDDVGASTLRLTASVQKTGFTPLYAAPELLEDSNEEETQVFSYPTRSSDLYSLGIIIWEVCSYSFVKEILF
jgi:serine/threonine protein kinase